MTTSLLTAWSAPAPAPIPRSPAAPAQRWEYYVAHFGSGVKWDEIQASLNAAGYEGWELVNADIERNQRIMGAPQQVTCFLKRQRAAQ